MKRRGFFRTIFGGFAAALLPTPSYTALPSASILPSSSEAFSLGTPAGFLTSAQAEKFLSYVMDTSIVAGEAKVIEFNNKTSNIRFSQRILDV